jgi:hypothetical protein
MAGASDFLEAEILDQIFGASAYVAPVTLYVALSTTAPTEAGASFTEPVGNGYARVAVTNNLTNFPAAVAGAKSNGTQITFPAATGAGWGTLTHFGIWDASSGGNLLCFAPLTASVLVVAGDTPRFPIGDLDITLD